MISARLFKARSGESYHLPGAAAERTPFGRVLAASRRRAALRLFVGDRLAEGWTPEQISGWLKSGNEPRLRAIGCETIYGFIYRTAQKAAALWRYLTRRHKRRRPRRARASRDAIKDRASIHDRPKTIEGRGEAGHWEGDLIICKRIRPVLVGHARRAATGKNAAKPPSPAMLAVFGHIDGRGQAAFFFVALAPRSRP